MTEFNLPQVNGADFARMVRETRSANRHTPIIAVTGYLKDLPETHYFDALIQKPPTLSKLTEALCRWCMWKPPPKDYNPSSQPLSVPISSARTHTANDDSPSSTSSGFVPHPPSSYLLLSVETTMTGNKVLAVVAAAVSVSPRMLILAVPNPRPCRSLRCLMPPVPRLPSMGVVLSHHENSDPVKPFAPNESL
jgi:hypothetical protein